MRKRLIDIILTLTMVFTFVPVTPAIQVEAASTINTGDYVQMGKYYGEPILWRCVDIDANGPLMLSDKILTIKPFDAKGDHKYLDGTAQVDIYYNRTSHGSGLWETSNMRSWLNSTASAGNVTWLDGCPPTSDMLYWSYAPYDGGYNPYDSEKGFLSGSNFTIEEKNIMKSVKQKSLLNSEDVAKLSVGGTAIHAFDMDISKVMQNFDTAYYQYVTDTMFLLDVKQLNKVYRNSNILGKSYYIGKPTQKAVDNSTYKDSSLSTLNNWFSWSRSPDKEYLGNSGVLYVGHESNVSAEIANYYYIGARPAFYLNLSSVIFKFGNGTKGTPYVQNQQNETRNNFLIIGGALVLGIAVMLLSLRRRKRLN